MLRTAKPSSAAAAAAASALIAFEPRQVTLAKNQNMKAKKQTSETLEATTTTTNDAQVVKKKMKKKKKKNSSEGEGSSPLLLSIAAYLGTKGFSKTLKAFKSEALTEEIDGLKEHSLDLEEMYNKYIETSNCGANANTIGAEKLDIQIEQVAEEGNSKSKGSKAKRKGSNGNDDDTVDEQTGVSNEVTKEKKKKSKVVPDSSGENPQQTEPQMDEPEKKPKDKKKKKSKHISESSTENADQAVQEALHEIPKEKTTDEEKNVKSKDKKTKKRKSQTLDLGGANAEVIEGDSKKSEPNVEKKDSKKRKRPSSEESEPQPDGEIVSKESKDIQNKAVEEDKGTAQMQMESTLQESDGHAGKKRKTENGQGEKSWKKQPNGSAEPKSVNAFKRVDIEKVKFVDERLQDNSYWAKDGADIGYGAKAQEVLGQVRGRDFRHEKTKKKRGSYRGGQIDLQSHSIKFNYSDEE